ncbi:MAG: YdjY domain-containing protein [Desulfobacteria bacterium]
MKKITIIAAILIALSFVISPAMAFSPQMKPNLVAIDQANKAVTFAGVITAEKWDNFIHPVRRGEKGFDPDNWHLIIAGTQANPAVNRVPLMVGWTTDVAVGEALESLGASGEILNQKSWYDYKNKKSPHIKALPSKGTPISVYVSWTDKDGKHKTVEANDFLENSTGKKFKGMYISKQHPSHCIVCLYGCIGGICSNSTMSTYDYFYGGAHWKLKKGVLPPDGTPVLITIKMDE